MSLMFPIDWAADINANDGDDIITTVGYGSEIDGGAGTDKLLIGVDDFNDLSSYYLSELEMRGSYIMLTVTLLCGHRH